MKLSDFFWMEADGLKTSKTLKQSKCQRHSNKGNSMLWTLNINTQKGSIVCKQARQCGDVCDGQDAERKKSNDLLFPD